METLHKVRLSDIAERLHVSTVTVSKALADKDGVGSELREKIKRTAMEMGYRQKADRPPPKGKHSTGNIGIIVPSRFFEHSTSFYWSLYNALSRELLASGYYAIMEQLNAQEEFDLALPHVILDKKVDGVILLGQLSDSYVRYFTQHYGRALFLDFYTDDADADCVVTDNFYGEYLLTEHLIGQGHRDIRFVGNFGATSSITDRFMGFMKAMLENGLAASPDDIINDRDARGLNAPIVLPERMPSAFVCNCDETAAALMTALAQHGYRVPQDVSVTGFDDFVSEGMTAPALTTIALDVAEIARTAVDILLRKITGRSYPHGRTVIGGKLVIRDSVRKINAGGEAT